MLTELRIFKGAYTGPALSRQLPISADDLEAVQANFNVSGNPDIDKLKLLGAAFIQACNDIGVSRELSVAKTEVEAATMWAVKGAVKIDQEREEKDRR